VMTQVPNVAGLAQAGAESGVIAADLVVGTIASLEHPSIPAGSVISQNPLSGASVLTGSAVDLVVSLGADVQNSYNAWSGGAAFNDDSNGDGIENGMAWVLGAPHVSQNAIGLLPTMDNTDPTYFIFNYRRKDDANNDLKTAISTQYCSTLTGWTTATAGPDVIINSVNDFHAAGIDNVEVKIRRTLAADGKLFARLKVTVTP
jgi:PASTA domain